jgi:hypothetical protein
VEIKGVDILGAAVNMTDSQNCLLEDCRLRYVEHAQEYPGGKMPAVRNVVSGKGNVWRRCLVAYGATTALAMSGESNALEDCVIHDANYLGSGRGGLDLANSIAARVEHCTIFRAGRDTIQHHASKRIRLEYNDLYEGNMLNNDAGAIYCWGTDGQGGIIAYNWVHDNPHCNGIYLDNFSSNFIVHHNVIWNCGGNAFHINSDALHHQIYNNTISQCNNAFGTYCYPAYVPTMKGTRIINNLVNEAMHPKTPSEFVQGELAPELSHNEAGAVDITRRAGTLRSAGSIVTIAKRSPSTAQLALSPAFASDGCGWVSLRRTSKGGAIPEWKCVDRRWRISSRPLRRSGR